MLTAVTHLNVRIDFDIKGILTENKYLHSIYRI